MLFSDVQFKDLIQISGQSRHASKKGNYHSEAVCFSFRLVISIFSTACINTILCMISETFEVTTTGGETVTTGCGVL